MQLYSFKMWCYQGGLTFGFVPREMDLDNRIYVFSQNTLPLLANKTEFVQTMRKNYQNESYTSNLTNYSDPSKHKSVFCSVNAMTSLQPPQGLAGQRQWSADLVFLLSLTNCRWLSSVIQLITRHYLPIPLSLRFTCAVVLVARFVLGSMCFVCFSRIVFHKLISKNF